PLRCGANKNRRKSHYPWTKNGGQVIGRPVLDRLVRDGILIPDGNHYFLDPAKIDQFLGVSWMRLREGEVNQKLVEYLQSIK
ncbi:MAG: hypothetical protein WBX38_07615, partial [Candidatus Sulfotelmatobacter sp.]